MPRTGAETLLTRGFTGRLGRGIRNALATAVESPSIARLPYPFQGHLVGVLKQAALAAGRLDLVPFWSGQSAPLVTHTSRGGRCSTPSSTQLRAQSVTLTNP